jgi:hemerythrin
MRYIELTNEMLTRVETMDEQHRMIIELGNDFIDPYTAKAGARFFLDALVFLADYIAYHVASEEFGMKEANYPDYGSHCRWHGLFTKQMSDCIRRAQKKEQPARLILDVSSMLETWLHRHVLTADQKFASFLPIRDKRISLPHPQALAIETSGIHSDWYGNRVLQKSVA